MGKKRSLLTGKVHKIEVVRRLALKLGDDPLSSGCSVYGVVCWWSRCCFSFVLNVSIEVRDWRFVGSVFHMFMYLFV